MGEHHPKREAGATAGPVRALAGREWPWLLAVAVGAGLRVHGLLDQVPVDDEWHAIHALLYLDYGPIALSFGHVDRCIPLSLLFKLAADTVGLGDAVLRGPSLLAGLLTLVVCPWLVRPLVGRRASQLFAWLLALAPFLVFYSRSARPYAIATLLAFVALCLVERWWQTGRRGQALGYGASAAGAVWFLPAVAPFVAAPLAGLALAGLGEPRRTLHRLLPPTLALLLFAAPLVGPPLLGHPEVLLAKLGAARPDAAGLVGAAGFLVGTRPAGWALLWLGLAALGAWRLGRRAPLWTGLALFACGVLVSGVLLSAPRYAWLGYVIGRYALPALPVLLLSVAVALDALGRRTRWLPALACAGLSVLWLWSGRVPALLTEGAAWFPGRWVTEMEGVAPQPRRVPEFYRELARRPPGSLTVVEAPWYYSLWNSLLPHYASIHGQRTLVGMTVGLCSDGHWGEYPAGRGVELRAFVPLAEPEALPGRGVDYVIFHHDLAGELARVVDPIDVRATGQPDPGACIEAYRRRGWEPVFRDEAIVVLAAPGSAGD